MLELKIGQEITIKEDFDVEAILSNTKLNVKVGDKGFVDSKGLLHCLSGEARGKIIKLEGTEMEGYDYENIARLIFRRLKNEFPLSDMLEDYDIDSKDFTESIEDVLSDIF